MYVRKKTYKKRYTRKGGRKGNGFAKAVKAVMYKQMETKSRITDVNDQPLFHNVPKLIGANLLITTQGVDGDGRSGNRIGSSINPIGIKLYIESAQYQPANMLNFLNGDIKVKVWILKTHHTNINTSGDFLRYINTNSLMAPVERRSHSTVKTMTFTLRNQYTAPTSGQVVDVAPAFITRIVYLPLKGKYLYENDISNVGKYFNYCVHACAYSAHPQVDTGIRLADFSLTTELFFKDP
jgi:hypothetical protein